MSDDKQNYKNLQAKNDLFKDVKYFVSGNVEPEVMLDNKTFVFSSLRSEHFVFDRFFIRFVLSLFDRLKIGWTVVVHRVVIFWYQI